MDDDEMDFVDFDADEEIQKSPAKRARIENNSGASSYDSFDDSPNGKSSAIEEMMNRYNELVERSSKIDKAAKELKKIIIISRQIEECYSKRNSEEEIIKKDIKLRYLSDGTVSLTLNVKNCTNEEMVDWGLVVRWTPIIFTTGQAYTSQGINLGILEAGMTKNIKIDLLASVELPIILHFSIHRCFQLENVTKAFQIQLDPMSLTHFDAAQIVSRPSSTQTTSFEAKFQLPHSLIDLICGCPDNISTKNVIKSVFPHLNSDEIHEETFSLIIPISNWENHLIKIKIEIGSNWYLLTMITENSKICEMLENELKIKMIVEMSKIKCRPEGNLEILPELGNVEQLYKSMISGF